jgi:tetratricopeptide (TPR) repeat protein
MRWADAFPRVDRFRAEHANIVGAIRWLYDSGRTAEFAELTGAVSSFWLAASMRTQAQPWLRLASDLQLATSPATARLLRNAGTIELELGDSRRAVDLIRRSIEQWAALGNDAERGDALRRLGGTLLDRGEMSEARAILEEAVELARAVDDGTTLRAALSDLAAVALIDGDLEQAHALALELLEASTRSGDRYGIAFAHYNLAYVLVERGAYVEAEAQIRDAILLFREVGKPEELAWANSTLAGIMLATNRSDAAADTIRLAIRPTPDGGNVAQLAAALDISAQIAVERGDDERAIRLAVAAERLRAGAELTLSPGERQRFDETIATARERLGPAYDRVAETARQTPIDAIVAAEHAEAEASPSPQ